jgi:hypothetical protein
LSALSKKLPHLTPKERVLLLLLLLVFIVLRLAFAQSSFSLDEILSLETAKASSNFFHPFYLFEDNNHLINTLYLYLVKNSGNWTIYRLLSVFFGCLTVLLPCVFFRLFASRANFYSVLLIFGLSFFLLTYQSEARGYSSLIFSAFFAYFLQKSTLADPKPTTDLKTILLFSCVNILGAISHPTFYFFYGALFFSALYKNYFPKVVRFHFFSLVGLSSIYLGFYAKIIVLGSSTRDPLEVITRAFGLSYGLSGLAVPLIIGFLVPIFLWQYFLLFKKREWHDLIFFTVLLFINLVFPYIQGTPEQVSERYFILPAIFSVYFLTLAAGSWPSKDFRSYSFALFIILFLAGNIYLITNFFRFGARGNYGPALRYMAEKEPTGDILIAGYQDFRILTLLNFYSQEAKQTGKKLIYLPGQQKNANWFITESQWHMRQKNSPTLYLGSLQLEPPPEKIDVFGVSYILAKTFPQYGLTGTQWSLYRNQSSPKLSP